MSNEVKKERERSLIHIDNIIKLLMDVGFSRIIDKDKEEIGYYLRDNCKRLEVYLKSSYIQIRLFENRILIDIFKINTFIFLKYGFPSYKEVSFDYIKSIEIYSMDRLENFLLFSIYCDSFLDYKEEKENV